MQTWERRLLQGLLRAIDGRRRAAVRRLQNQPIEPCTLRLLMLRAVVQGDARALAVLLGRPDVDRAGFASRLVARAVMRSDAGVLRVLLSCHGIDPCQVLADGSTALLLAVETGRDDLVRLLLRHPLTDASHRRADGYTAWDLARLHGYSACLVVLQQYRQEPRRALALVHAG